MSDVLALTVPALLAGVGLYGALTGTDVFSALTAGALDGLRTVVRIFPALVALLAAVSMLRASGALDALMRLCAPVLAWLGIPPETAALLLVRPVSGSGALAVGSQLMEQYGPDSAVGRTAAGLLGDHVLHRGGVFRRGRHPPHPLYHSRRPDGGPGSLHCRRLGRAAVLRRRITRFRCCQTAKSVI